MAKFSKSEKNLLRCWLYDNIYWHLPQNQEPNVDTLYGKAVQLKRVKGLENLAHSVIRTRIVSDITTGVWRDPPTPYTLATAELFPHWKSWSERKQTPTPAPTPKAPSPPIPSPPSPPLSPPAVHKSTVPVEVIRESIKPENVPGPSVNSQKEAPTQKNTINGSTAPQEDSLGGQESSKGKVVANQQETAEYNAATNVLGGSSREAPTDSGNFLREKLTKPLENPKSEDNTSDSCKRKLEQLVVSAPSLFLNSESESSKDNILTYAPLFDSDVLKADIDFPPQCAIFGKLLGPESTTDQRILFSNTNTPWTVFICGVQGAGKSHSLTVMLENCLVPNESIGVLKEPLAGIVFYYSPYHTAVDGKPCEAAYLANPSHHHPNGASVQKVTVLVSRYNFGQMKAVYSRIPNITVEGFLLNPSQLTINAMLYLMSVQQNHNPLYIQLVNRVLREMAGENDLTGEVFDYEKFKERIFKEKLTKDQKNPLQQRLSLLESFIGPKDSPNLFEAKPGTLTIVDLTSPFIDAETACILFSICNELFASAPCASNKVIALDEAHRYMSDHASPPVQRFAHSIIGNIRYQRHIGVGTIISTQDPLIHPELLELSSMVIFHRFSSPRWFDTLRKYVGFQSQTQVSDSDGAWPEDEEPRKGEKDVFNNIMDLNTGEAYIYCPQLVTSGGWGWEGPTLKKFGQGVFKVRVRQKVTVDGGASKNVV